MKNGTDADPFLLGRPPVIITFFRNNYFITDGMPAQLHDILRENGTLIGSPKGRESHSPKPKCHISHI